MKECNKSPFKYILAALIALTFSSAFAEKVELILDGVDQPLTCELLSEQYFCVDGESYLFGIPFGSDFSVNGSLNGKMGQHRVTHVASKSDPSQIYFDGSEVENNPFFTSGLNYKKPNPSYILDLMSLNMMKNFLMDYPVDSKEISEIKKVIRANVDRDLKLINEKFLAKDRKVTLESGEELACKQAEANSSSSMQCTLYNCDLDGESLYYVTYPDPSYGVNYLFSINEKGFPRQEYISRVDFENDERPIVEVINFFGKGSDFSTAYEAQQGQYSAFAQSLFPIQKPEFELSQLMPQFDSDEESSAFNSFIASTTGDLLKDTLLGCSEKSYEKLSGSVEKLREKVATDNYVQYISDFNNGLVGYYLGVENLPDKACQKDGVFYNPEVYETVQRIQAYDEKQIKPISMEQAQELFDKARAMDDIAWNYKQDGCYARAHLMARRFEEMGVQVDKAWLKGSLRAKGENGEIDTLWNFHVAPVVYVENKEGKIERMVIDPSIEKGPVTAMTWAKNLSSDVDGKVETTTFPYPENSAYHLRNSLAFSNSDPYLPMENRVTDEITKMDMAERTMFEYKGYGNEEGFRPVMFGNSR